MSDTSTGLRLDSAVRATPAGLYRCYHCEGKPGVPGLDFTAPAGKAVCPKCGSAEGDPVLGRFVVRLVVVHFEPTHGKIQEVRGKNGRGGVRGPVGCGHLACDPTKPTGHGHYQYSGEPSAVNCPACKETDEFKAADGGRVHPAYDLPMEFDAAGDLQFTANPEGVSLKPAMAEAVEE